MSQEAGELVDQSDAVEADCRVCGEAIWWDASPDPICRGCAKKPARSCGNCEFYDANTSATEGVGYCTNPVGWHRARSMPTNESCSKWAPAPEET